MITFLKLRTQKDKNNFSFVTEENIPFSMVFECSEKNLQSFLVLFTTWNVKYHGENIQYYYLNIICFTSKLRLLCTDI